jgi:hypothetical protein
VNRWLAGRLKRLALSGRSSTHLGIVIPRGSTESVASGGIKILLERSAKMRNGYLIVTAMVIE